MSLSITFRAVKSSSNLVAFAEVTIHNIYTVSGIKVWNNGQKGYKVQLPGTSNKSKTGRTYYNESFKFVNKRHTESFCKAVLDAYLYQSTPEEKVAQRAQQKALNGCEGCDHKNSQSEHCETCPVTIALNDK